jgi:hypothetical protein
VFRGSLPFVDDNACGCWRDARFPCAAARDLTYVHNFLLPLFHGEISLTRAPDDISAGYGLLSQDSRDRFAGQKENVTCRSTRRLAVFEEYGPPASPLDSPNSGELKFPTGVAKFTLLSTFRADTAKVKP